jgi:hypothetical protein
MGMVSWERWNKLIILVKSIRNSDCVNTWSFVLPLLQMQNRLEIGRKIVSCDHTFTSYSSKPIKNKCYSNHHFTIIYFLDSLLAVLLRTELLYFVWDLFEAKRLFSFSHACILDTKMVVTIAFIFNWFAGIWCKGVVTWYDFPSNFQTILHL